MKDSKGHGSNKQGGPTKAPPIRYSIAHTRLQEKVANKMKNDRDDASALAKGISHVKKHK